jgi:hypothetical protein
MLCSVGGVLHSPSATHLPRRTWPQRVGVLCAVNANLVSLGTRSTFDGLWNAREHSPSPLRARTPVPFDAASWDRGCLIPASLARKSFPRKTWRRRAPGAEPWLPQALETLTAWGVRYLSQIVWRKMTRNGKVPIGTGYRVRCSHELVLFGGFGGRQRHAAFPSIFDGLAREHSRKPDEFYRMVVERTPRSGTLRSVLTRDGFVGWGNEHGKFDRA